MRASRRSLFFFQAEDGIRDHCVTGVQTCALPIFPVQNISIVVGVRYHQQQWKYFELERDRRAIVCAYLRSEERRVGKECRCGWSSSHQNKSEHKRTQTLLYRSQPPRYTWENCRCE